MATDATGTATSPDNIPKFNVGTDAPTGNGTNAMMDQIQAIISGLRVGTAPGGKIKASTALTATGTPSSTTFLAGDDTWKPVTSGSVVQISRTVSPGASWNSGTLPTSYSSLFITFTAQSDQGGFPHWILMRFNGDTTANYDSEGTYSAGTTVTAEEFLGATALRVSQLGALINGTTNPSRGRIEIPDYRETTFKKGFAAISATCYGTNSGQNEANQYSGFWRSNAAITSIQLLPETGSFNTGTIITLYGIV